MQELYIDERAYRDEAGTTHTFQYFLLQDETSYENCLCTDYGIMVRSSGLEQVSIPHITADRDRITGLLNLLCAQGVSPVHLRDVIEDWL